VRIALGDHRTLERKDVHVDRRDNETRIRIERKSLPAIAADPPAPEAEDAIVNSQNIQPGDKPEVAPDQSRKAVPPSLDNQPSVLTPPIAKAKGPGLPATSIFASPTDTGAEQLEKPNQSGIVLLAVVSLALLGVYLVIKFGLIKRAKPSLLSDIEIIGSKRLGARHQLILVRALGEDHLLSINAGHTERIASVPTPQGSERTGAPEDEPELGGFFSRRKKSLWSGQENAGTARTPLEEEQPFPKRPQTQPYGADLLHFGKRGERSPLEQLNVLEAKRTNGSNHSSEPKGLNTFLTG
jgi:flagellar biogenesis protein FliO